MKPNRFLLLILFTGLSMLGFSQKAQPKVAQATIEELKQVSDKKADVQILDVRTPGETNVGVVEGAIINDISSADFKKNLATLDKNKPVYVYCEAGGRSAKAAQILVEMGFKDVHNVGGGMAAWRAKKYAFGKAKTASKVAH